MTEQDVKDINSVIQFTTNPETRYAELTLIISDGAIKHKNIKYEIGRKKASAPQEVKEPEEKQNDPH